ncbi:tRNA (N(6)-L-threonylcarbamoyladenosine(37)-C(2))-methylthiotransferase MtaB [Sulfuricurvum sp.]|uniref:tRNA (N(6)-L-threonylcarbamoyladenosine(37)-C(2))- methylthiotransferase MtaB n=1 Tax=Sulfuricurvum sp. TaxID=2025608 RepID=UPI0019C3751F|nr:tRNA (N(6)-L-threonylcarbamoyladenosine(37)-C(2))-methylthiotransferase MtaB [Sulfuricurvum sp.]MBD3798449.1 tRNA (N(6)-L-threonylcarbamoyladenosine(37)-C(2))-methylthiotransferase MtaB [Campylobacterota bacterium]MBD3805810.1 tRNA (N(6)-L-threonylcarbamoyladenosine(37)-C(2))-methylthiotransferase MtaB [Sulfuricurvum sp.]
MKPKVFFKTFGCRTNVFDSQVMMGALRDYEVTENESEADIVIVNSCTVTNGADVSVRGYINRMDKQGKKLFLTGCGAHTKGESLFASGKIQGVFGQSEKMKINTLLSTESRFYEIGDLNYIDDAIVEEFIGKSRAFIKIQEGCNFRCSYCIIPFVRGDARSMDEAKILEQVSRLAGNGFGEFVLTGTNVGSYGHGEGRNIAELMKKMSLIRGVRRIRVGSLEPIQINEAFREILDEPWLERHLHIAIQHSSDEMLRLMNRRNRNRSDAELFSMLHERGFALGTDFIVGHPGESDALWREAMENIRSLHLTHIHPFTYSKRDGTPSATMKPEINGAVSAQRMAELNERIHTNNLLFRMSMGKVPLEVLVESYDGQCYVGYDQFFNKVLIESQEDLIGSWITLEDYEVDDEHNVAKF